MRITNLWTSLAASFVGLAAAFSVTAASAGTKIIVDTGDPTQLNGGYSLLPIGGAFGPGFPGQSIAARFTVTQDLVITSIEGLVARYGAGASTYHLALYEDGPGPDHWIPGAELYDVALSDGGVGTGYIGSDDLDWAVGPGNYWIAFEVRAGDTLTGFMPYFVPRPLQEAAGPVGDYHPLAGAPGSGFRITGVVPEPATWALMILGFGAAGVALRTRRRVVIA